MHPSRHLLPAVLLLQAAVLSVSCSDRSSARLHPLDGAEAVNVDTHFQLTFDEVPSVGKEGWIRIYDEGTGRCVDSLDLSVPAGPTESRTYAPDIDYTKVPYDYARSVVPTNRNTLRDG